MTGTVWTLGVNCGTGTPPDFQDCLNKATHFGDEIVLPAGTANAVTPVSGPGFYPPAASDATPITAVDQSSGTFTVVSNPFANNQAIRLGASYFIPSPLNIGYTYYVVNATTTSFQVASSSGGAPIQFKDGGLGTVYALAWPITQSGWITIRTSTPDNQLPPPGVRLNSQDPSFAQYASKLAYINAAPSQVGVTGQQLMNWSQGALAHNYYFIGVATLAAATAVAGANTDPPSNPGLWAFSAQNANVVIDRSWIHGLGYPNRLRGGIQYFDGAFMALINSSLDGVNFWRPWKTGLQTSFPSSSTATVGAGIFHLGNSTCTLSSPATFSVTGGSASGTGLIYFDLSCKLIANLPNGITATGTGLSVINSAAPSWPVDPNGRTAVGQMAVLNVNGTSISGYEWPGSGYSVDTTEGSFGIDIGRGPGPTKLENNYIEDTGIPVFWSDDASMNGGCSTFCYLLYTASDSILRRNTVTTPLNHMVGGPISDGRRYSHRNNLEWKTGKRVLLDGNIISNNWSENNAGPAVLFNTNNSNLPNGTSQTVNEISDVEARYNSLIGNANEWIVGGHGLGGINVAKLAKRIWFHDNLTWQGNGWTRASVSVPGAVSGGAATGTYQQSGAGPEDFIQEHNTIFDIRGYNPINHWIIGSPAEGFVNRNNVEFMSNDANYNGFLFSGNLDAPAGSPDVPNYAGSGASTALANTLPLHVWDHNVIIGGWTDSKNLVEMSQTDVSNVATQYPAGNQTIWPVGSSLSQRVAAVKFYNSTLGNFRLRYDSPYLSGGSIRATDGFDIGANIDALEAAQGKVTNVHVFAVTSNSATVSFVAPDTFGCSVDWSSNSFAAFTRTLNPGGSRVQNVFLSSLPGQTSVQYRVNCAVVQPIGSFQTR